MTAPELRFTRQALECDEKAVKGMQGACAPPSMRSAAFLLCDVPGPASDQRSPSCPRLAS